MRPEEKLEKLFETARKQPSLMNNAEIEQLIVNNTKSNYLKKANIMKITILSLLTASVIGFFQFRNPKTIQSNKSLTQTETPKEFTEKVMNSVVDEYEEESKIDSKEQTHQKSEFGNISANKNTKKTVQNHFIDESITSESNSDILTQIAIEKDSNIASVKPVILEESDSSAYNIDLNKTIYLTSEELAKFGIFIKDSVLLYEMNKTKLGRFKFDFVAGRGARLNDLTSESFNFIINIGNNPIPVFFSSPNGRILFKSELETDSLKEATDFEKIAKNLIPIKIDYNYNGIDGLIIWLENNQYVNKLLPQRYQDNTYKYLNNHKFYMVSDDIIIFNNTPRKDDFFKSIVFDTEQIVIPSDDLLRKLGFEKRREIGKLKFKRRVGGYTYITYNYGNGEFYSSLRYGCYNIVTPKKIKEVIPFFISDMEVKSRGNVTRRLFVYCPRLYKKNKIDLTDGYASDGLQDFINNLPQMIAIKVRMDLLDKEHYRLFWYPISEPLLAELPEDKIQEIEKLKEKNEALVNNKIKINNSRYEVQNYAQISGFESVAETEIKGINLNKTQLEKLGIQINDKEVFYYEPYLKSNNSYEFISLNFTKNAIFVNKEISSNIDFSEFVQPVLITDDLGNNRVSFGDKSYSNLDLNSLIPITVKSGSDYSTLEKISNLYRPDLVFWYEPSEKFFNVLDSKTAEEIKNDIEAIKCVRSKSVFSLIDSACTDEREVSCKYFESCENEIKNAVLAYQIFPNPANDFVNVKLDLIQGCNVSIMVFALNGDLIQIDKFDNQIKGRFNEKIKLDKLSSGMFLIRVQTDKGDSFAERIIVVKQ